MVIYHLSECVKAALARFRAIDAVIGITAQSKNKQMSEKKILIQLNNATFAYPEKDPLFENLKLTVSEEDVTALVGINGSGKSTLLKLLADKLKLTSGSKEVNGRVYYVPQVDLSVHPTDKSVYEYISEHYENWWEIPNETQRLFNLELDTEAQIRTLSGGELMKLNLAIALSHKPDVLILDEPTNHLDIKSVNNLVSFIKDKGNKYTYLIVSHDTFFLDSVTNNILELNNGQLTSYGGNYSFYKEQKELHLKGVKKRHAIAKHKLATAESQAQKEYERQQQKAAKAKKDVLEGKEQDKYIRGMKKDSGTLTMKTRSTSFEKTIEQTQDLIDEVTPDDARRLAFMNLKNTNDNKGKTIFDLDKATLKIDGKTLLKDIDLKALYGDRLVISGDNGSGKTTLIKGLIKLSDPDTKDTFLGNAKLSGETFVGEKLNWVYIDQNYSLIDPTLTLLENLMSYHPEYTKDRAKEQLGKFQFKSTAEMNKLGSDLSGGEMVRLIMSMITAFPIDVIILDEPTNNLDVETIEVLIKALNNFRGTIVVISHNIDFLNAINIKHAYLIKGKKLLSMKTDPSKKEAYFKELVS